MGMVVLLYSKGVTSSEFAQSCNSCCVYFQGFSPARGSACFSRLVASSDPRIACWELCVEPSAEKLGPCLCTDRAVLQLGTLSAYNLKSHCRVVPKRNIGRRKNKTSLKAYVFAESVCRKWNLTNPVEPPKLNIYEVTRSIPVMVKWNDDQRTRNGAWLWCGKLYTRLCSDNKLTSIMKEECRVHQEVRLRCAKMKNGTSYHHKYSSSASVPMCHTSKL